MFAAAALFLTPAAQALDYPSRPVRWIVAFPPGGANDIIARVIGQALSQRLGQPFIVENKPGAGGNIGTQLALAAPADGYTLLFVAPHNAINATLYKKLSFDFLRDSTPVAGLARGANVMEVNPSVPARTVGEFIAYAKANPGKIAMASAGNGTAIHLSGELFMAMTGVQLVHVPYRGGAPALNDLIGGQVQVMFDNLPSSLGHIRAGALRALAMTTAARSQTLPDVPTVAETVSGYEASIWYGVVAPKGTPAEVVAKLNAAINAVLGDAAIKERLAELGCTPMPMSAAEFGSLLATETAKWANVVKFSGASMD
ncbi:MAG TPA: tripartite tricarboxylate transporter substrate binding protein [Pseudolabrys sp.]|nr:tripartite tricarboxylate transporter substrate binding protein [Pseudolabrys sp.]